jgi:hypothetical protein
VAADDLSAPLGQDRTPKRRRALPIAIPKAAVGVLSLSVIVVAGWALIVDDPFGGEPIAVVRTDLGLAPIPGGKSEQASTRPPGQAADERPNRPDGQPPAEAAPPSTPTGRTVTIIDGTSGKRQEIVLPGPVEDASRAEDQKSRLSVRPKPKPETRNP